MDNSRYIKAEVTDERIEISLDPQLDTDIDTLKAEVAELIAWKRAFILNNVIQEIIDNG
jgi:hypothetical protein